MHESKQWGRIPKALEEAGYPVFFGNQDAWGTVASNAQQIARAVDYAIEQTGASGVVIVAHSKGGLDAIASSNLPGMAGKIAAIITLSTPHRGMRFCDGLLRSKVIIPKVAAPCVNAWAHLRGDVNPDSYDALRCLGTEGNSASASSLERDDGEQGNVVSIGFSCPQQKAFVSRWVSKSDGPNDGLVPLGSTQAHEWREVMVSCGQRPYGHDDCTDSHSRDFEYVIDGVAFPSTASLICALVDEIDAP